MSTIRHITKQQYLDLGRVGIPVYACYFDLTQDRIYSTYLLSLFRDANKDDREARYYFIKDRTYKAKFFYTLVEDSE